MNAVTARRRTSVIFVAVLSVLLSIAFAQVSRPARAADPLISQGKTATASSTENAGTPASAAVDGNLTSTRWSSAFADPQWLQVDLGATANVSQVVLTWEAAYGKSFQIQTSPDATTWTSIYSTTTGTGGTQTLSVTGSGRYVRMYGTVRGTTYGYSLYELQVYGTFPTAPTGCSTTNIAQGKTATASSLENAGDPASAAVDGNTGTRWSSAFSDPQWLQVDLGSTQSICQVTLNWEAAYATAFQIQTSNDASTWTSIYSTTTGTGGIQTLNVSGSGRYVRMYGTTRATAYGYSIWELGVFAGTGGGGGGGNTGVCPTQSDTPDFGPNVHVFDPSMSAATIQAQLNTDFAAQKDTNTAQFATSRVAELYKPGTYAVEDNVGFYTTVAGLGLNPDDVTINGDVTVDAFNSEDQGNATQNFWREADNLSINPTSGTDRWAVAQAAPFRRIDRPRQPGAAPGELRLRLRRLHLGHQGQRSGVVGVAAAVVLAEQQLRQLDRRRLEHGVLRRDRRAGRERSRARRRPCWPPRRSPGTCPYLYVTTRRQVPRVRTFAAYQRFWYELGEHGSRREPRCR